MSLSLEIDRKNVFSITVINLKLVEISIYIRLRLESQLVIMREDYFGL